jgi:hypothetical protein
MTSKFSSVAKVKPPTKLVKRTVETVAFWHGIEPDRLLSRRRDAITVAARVDAIRNLHAFGRGRFSSKSIGRAIGIDHATVIYWICPERRARHLERVNARHRNKSHDHS